MRISFTILGIPQGKGRPRFTRFGQAYTTPKTKIYEETLRANYKRLSRHKFSENALLIFEIRECLRSFRCCIFYNCT
jgi:hypothetical protein